jgi:hypothetical protein
VTGDDPRAQRLAVLAAVDAALADPARLVHLLADAEDDADAAHRIRQAFGLDEVQAAAVLDLQFRRLSRSARARLRAQLELLRTPWGPPVGARLHVSGRRSAVLTVDDVATRITGGGADDLLERVRQHLTAEVAAPQRRPVEVVLTGLPGGPGRLTVHPDGSARYDDYPDEIRG